MKKWMAAPVLAGVLTIGAAGVTEATTAPNPAPAQTDTSSNNDDSSKAGLWGLLGLLGLAGLAGLKRRNEPVRYDTTTPSSTRV
jgi:MYXO-CTERM domain-containing protein